MASSGAGAGSKRMNVFGSPGSRFGDSRAAAASPPSSSQPSSEETRRLAPEPSSSDMNSPPPIFDQLRSRNIGGGLLSHGSANAEGSEDA